MMIGGRIRDLRQDNGFTLEDLSNKSGIALATLSRIENEKMVGTLDSHLKLSKALGITLSQLFLGLEGDSAEIALQKQDLRKDVYVHNTKYSTELLTSGNGDKTLTPIMIKLLPGGNTDKESTKIGIEKFIYVLEGKIEAAIGDENYQLGPGDTLYFNASLMHQLSNTGNMPAKCICVVSP